MRLAVNPFRGEGISSLAALRALIVSDPASARSLFRMCPSAAATPLREEPGLAARLGLGSLYIKDERGRMGLGSFKALGAVHAIAREAVSRSGDASAEALKDALRGEVFVCASAGNHGLSVAAGARLFGGSAVVYISERVPEAFAERLREKGATVVRHGADYEASMSESARVATERGWTLLSDSSWPGYQEPARRVMEGYLIAADEVVEETHDIPTHVFLQAGVGGFAASMAVAFRRAWGDDPVIVVVEPESASCLTDSILAGAPVRAPGPASSMGRLDCKEASHLALAGLSRDADYFMTIEDGQAEDAAVVLSSAGIETTPSGAAGVAAAVSAPERLGEKGSVRGLVFVTEGPEEPQ